MYVKGVFVSGIIRISNVINGNKWNPDRQIREFKWTKKDATVYKLDLNKKLLPKQMIKLFKESSFTFNPKQAKGGRNQDAACLDTLPVQ